MTERLLDIKELRFDEKLYPRMKISWKTAYSYAQAMKTGSVFPSITVGILNDKKLVVDGWHRIEACKMNKVKYIKAEVKKYSSEKEFFLDAIKKNAHHGRPLSTQEKLDLINRLGDFKIDKIEASKLVGINIKEYPKLIQRRTLTLPNGKKEVLKSSLERAKPLIKELVNNDYVFDQSEVYGTRADSLVDDLILVLDLGSFPRTEDFFNKLFKLKKLVDQVVTIKAEVIK